MSEEPRKRWTRAEYRNLIETGVLEGGRCELVLGEIWGKWDRGVGTPSLSCVS